MGLGFPVWNWVCDTKNTGQSEKEIRRKVGRGVGAGSEKPLVAAVVKEFKGRGVMEDKFQVPAETIRQDIADTEAEIVKMTREVEGFRLIGGTMSMLRADSRVIGIKERQEFIDKLNTILKSRGGE